MPLLDPEGDTSRVDSACFLSEVSPHDKPWDAHKSSAAQVARMYREVEYTRYAERVESCANWLQFVMEARDTGELNPKLYSARFCRVRHCPVCQWRRSLMWTARFLKAMPKVIEQHPNARFVFLTLTVQNCSIEELRKTITWMNRSWQRMTQRKQFPALGFARSVEVTRSKDGTAHPHFHCLLMVRPSYFTGHSYLSQAKWSELWKSCLRVNYTPIVNVKSVKLKPGVEGDDNKALAIAICETFKYTVKEADLVANSDWLAELTKQLHNTRAVSIGGLLKDYISEDEPEDLIHGDLQDEEEEYGDIKLVFDWFKIVKKYAKR